MYDLSHWEQWRRVVAVPGGLSSEASGGIDMLAANVLGKSQTQQACTRVCTRVHGRSPSQWLEQDRSRAVPCRIVSRVWLSRWLSRWVCSEAHLYLPPGEVGSVPTCGFLPFSAWRFLFVLRQWLSSDNSREAVPIEGPGTQPFTAAIEQLVLR